MLFRWLSDLFSQCQGCDQLVSPEEVQAATYLREVAPFRVQATWLCPTCYAGMFIASVDTRSEEMGLFLGRRGEPLKVRNGARGSRTLTALQPEDFKSSTSTISSSPRVILHNDSITLQPIGQVALH
jgi:hypothetical protein